MGELVKALVEAGLSDVRITTELDPFRGTNKEHIARRFGVIGVNVLGRYLRRA